MSATCDSVISVWYVSDNRSVDIGLLAVDGRRRFGKVIYGECRR